MASATGRQIGYDVESLPSVWVFGDWTGTAGCGKTRADLVVLTPLKGQVTHTILGQE